MNCCVDFLVHHLVSSIINPGASNVGIKRGTVVTMPAKYEKKRNNQTTRNVQGWTSIRGKKDTP